jgi:hypothetical protein
MWIAGYTLSRALAFSRQRELDGTIDAMQDAGAKTQFNAKTQRRERRRAWFDLIDMRSYPPILCDSAALRLCVPFQRKGAKARETQSMV